MWETIIKRKRWILFTGNNAFWVYRWTLAVRWVWPFAILLLTSSTTQNQLSTPSMTLTMTWWRTTLLLGPMQRKDLFRRNIILQSICFAFQRSGISHKGCLHGSRWITPWHRPSPMATSNDLLNVHSISRLIAGYLKDEGKFKTLTFLRLFLLFV